MNSESLTCTGLHVQYDNYVLLANLKKANGEAMLSSARTKKVFLIGCLSVDHQVNVYGFFNLLTLYLPSVLYNRFGPVMLLKVIYMLLLIYLKAMPIDFVSSMSSSN